MAPALHQVGDTEASSREVWRSREARSGGQGSGLKQAHAPAMGCLRLAGPTARAEPGRIYDAAANVCQIVGLGARCGSRVPLLGVVYTDMLCMSLYPARFTYRHPGRVLGGGRLLSAWLWAVLEAAVCLHRVPVNKQQVVMSGKQQDSAPWSPSRARRPLHTGPGLWEM